MNRYLGRGFWRLHSDKKKLEQLVGEAFLIEKANGRVPPSYIAPCTVKRSVRITTFRKRIIDQDNISTKALLDVLKRLEFIKDDSPRWLTLIQPTQVSVGKHGIESTVVEIK
jgi:Holliday junction resolvase RusA-like endonuclease